MTRPLHRPKITGTGGSLLLILFSLRTLMLGPVFVLPPLLAWHCAHTYRPLIAVGPMAQLTVVFYLHVAFFCGYFIRGGSGSKHWLRPILVGCTLGLLSAGAMAIAIAGARLEYETVESFLKSPNRAILAVGTCTLVAVLGGVHGGSIGACVAAFRGISESFGHNIDFDRGPQECLKPQLERAKRP